MTGLLRRLRARLRYRNFDADLQRELDVHRAMAEDALRVSGTEPGDVQWQAARDLGNVTLAREDARSVWIAPWIESVWQDVRYGVRSLRHSPGFTAAAVLTLVLGVGVNTTLFSMANSLLFRPWRVPDADELVLLWHQTTAASRRTLFGIPAPELDFLRQHASSVDVAGIRQVGGTLASGTLTRSARARLVTSNYFDVLKVPIAIGRRLQREDDRPGGPVGLVLSHELWASFFSSDPAIVGRTVTFRDAPVVVLGVAAAGVQESPVEPTPELWLPLWSLALVDPDDAFAREFMTNPAHCCVDLVGRLRPGASRSRAEAEISALDRQFRGDADRDGAGMRVTEAAIFYQPEAAKARPVLALLSAGALLVLLLTCANVGNLQLARAAARRRELTVRMALGAARRRVVRQLLTEGLLLSAIATACSLAVSVIVTRLIASQLEAEVARLIDSTIDLRVLLFAAGLTVTTALVTSLAPALRGTGHLVAGRSPERATLRLRSAFLATQVAVSVVLLVAAALLNRGLAQAAAQDVGFRLDSLVAMKIERQTSRRDADTVFLRDVLSALSGSPVAAAPIEPLGDVSMHTVVRRANEPGETDRPTQFQPVSSNYFQVLGIPLRAGRTFSDGSTDEVVLNETLARMLWPGGDAVGHHLAGEDGTAGRQVVGIVADAHLTGLGGVAPMIFEPARSLNYLLFDRSAVAPDAVHAVVAAVDRSAAAKTRGVGDNVGGSLEAATQGARVAGGFGLLALAVAAVGIAGVFSFVVTQRTREIGIRVALGATRQRVTELLLRRASRPIAAGLGLGLLMAMLAGPVLRSYLYGLSPSDPLAYVIVVLMVVATAWTATLLPLRRAVRIDPAVTLRHD